MRGFEWDKGTPGSRQNEMEDNSRRDGDTIQRYDDEAYGRPNAKRPLWSLKICS